MIELGDIEDAAKRLSKVAVRTPLLKSAELDEITGGTVLLKPECLQVTGTFKIRGAYNLMSRLSAEQASKGVVAWSSGNHAQGVAAAGGLLGIKTAIVMPEDAPKSKIGRTKRFGGEVILYDRYTGDREAIAREVAAERGAGIVPSYDHEDIVAGQGTVGLEIARHVKAKGIDLDAVLAPCGGGGLISGIAIAMAELCPGAKIYSVEPAGFDDTARSLAAGRRRQNAPGGKSFCDALLAPEPGELTFAVNKRLLTAGLAVTELEVAEAMAFAFEHLKLIVEPGGAVALAAILAAKFDCTGKTVAVVASGGNVDPEVYTAALGRARQRSGEA